MTNRETHPSLSPTFARESRAADRVVKEFEERIRSGQLAEGEPIPTEREIGEELGVSRTVAREAVQILSNKGLIEARPRFRPIVKKPSYESAVDMVGGIVMQMLNQPGGVKNLFDTRVMVEAALVREAALKANAADVTALSQALADCERVVEDSEAFYKYDVVFHAILYDISRNPVLQAVHRAYTTWLADRWTQMPRSPERNRKNNASHRAIYEAILARDPDRAEAKLRSHLSDAWEQVRLTFGDEI